jgi:hypothetical protein
MAKNDDDNRTFEGNDVQMPDYRLERGNESDAACCSLYMQTFARDSDDSVNWHSSPKEEWVRVAIIEPNQIQLFPVHVNPYAQRYLKPRHGPIHRIVYVDNSQEHLPEDSYAAREQLNHRLPFGSFVTYENAFGLVSELDEVCRVLASTFHKGTLIVAAKGKSHIGNDAVVVSASDLDALRRTMNRIDRRKRDGVRRTKQNAVFNELLTKLDPERFVPLNPAAIRLVEVDVATARRVTPLERRATLAAVATVRASLPALAANSASALLELRSEIERVTLAEMIARYEDLLAAELPENRWQAFFQNNLFVLSLVFARPVRLLQSLFHAQGSSLDGSGAQVGDFLLRESGQGLAIVEIKKPATELIRSRPYRNTQVYGPSDELGGAITQTLFQQSLIRANWLVHQGNAALKESKPDVIKCVVVAGRMPTEGPQRRSFEVFRNACKDVDVITFDELLGKLRLLLQHLTPQRNVDTEVPF